MTGKTPEVDFAADKEDQGKESEASQEAVESHLESFARHLAASHVPVQRSRGRTSISKFLEDYRSDFQEAVQYFRQAGEQELAQSYAAEWTLDNYYLVLQALRQIAEDLPPRYYQQLPKLIGGPLEGQPRVYALAREVIVFEKAHLDVDRVQRFVRAYEAVTPLTMGELWAFPIMLRLGISQCLVFAVGRITGRKPKKERPEPPDIDLSDQLKDDEVVANCFISLRLLSAIDWKEFFESLSLVESILGQDPAGYYAGMDFETRDHYRKVVEELALQTGKDELGIARETIRLAQAELARTGASTGTGPEQGDGRDPNRGQAAAATAATGSIASKAGFKGWPDLNTPREAHVGYYLLDEGRRALEACLDFRPVWQRRFHRWVFAHPTLVYLGSVSGITLLLVFLLVRFTLNAGSSGWQGVLAGILGLIPFLTVAVNLVNWVITNAVKPRVLPKMDFKDGLPIDCSSVVVVPTLLSNTEEVKSLLHQLELHYLRNPDPFLFFALLTDLADGLQQHLPGDEALLTQAQEGVRLLNEKYRRETGGPFYLLHRERRWNPAEGLWMGWERKRGKLHELNQLLLGSSETSYTIKIGELSALPTIKYVITLDTDTILPRESAARLIATLAHPLNRAKFDPQGEEVVAGYTILQPRTEINPSRIYQSWFTRIFTGDTGLDLYTLAVSDVYQDFFGEGIYVGKGIYDIRAFERSLAGRIPENALLSHDLFEGISGRAGLVTDIVLIEDYPPNYLAYVHRLHRWVRGDWQLLPWLLPRVPSPSGKRLPNRLSLIDHWKIFDNLRRSLDSPVLLAFFMVGWLWLPRSPIIWTLLGAFSLSIPFLTGLGASLVQLFKGAGLRKEALNVRDSAIRWLLALAFLPYEAILDLDAILTTLVRLLITRKRMLQWTTAAQDAHIFVEELNAQNTRKRMIIGLLLSLALALLLGLYDPHVLLAAIPLLVLWLLSSEIAYWISLPTERKPALLSESQRNELRNLARRTWLFFEQFLGPEDHWLPPDHFQEVPLGVIAHRTSPTNMGLALLSSLGAYDLGYIGLFDLAARLRTTFENMEKLERYRGHFLNWYDTRSLDPLPPGYVSTVDSGNLAACLIALGQGCLAIRNADVLRWENWAGLLDTLALMVELIEGFEDAQATSAVKGLYEHLAQIRQQVLSLKEQPDVWMPRLYELSGQVWEELDRRLMALVEMSSATLGSENLRRLRIIASRVRHHLDNMIREIDLLLPWLELIHQPPAIFEDPGAGPALMTSWQNLIQILERSPNLNEIGEIESAGQAQVTELQRLLAEMTGPSELVRAASDWCKRLSKSLDSAAMTAKILIIGYQELYRQAEDYVRDMDFQFLFDPGRQVFHIGYNLSLGKLDNNYYDLLESEARIASLIAIAKGDIPQSHWLHLSRPLTQVDGNRVLLSWSATMFEYLMPDLLLRSYPGTLLDHSASGAVDYQIDYGKGKKVPWGISESGYYRFDANMVYQYRAFGVPGLGFKRGLGDDLVISPYASLLALPLRPQEVSKNIADLKQLQMMGTYGLYEAIDFTESRLSLGHSYEIVQEYMAHHQGMILLSLVNYDKTDIMVHRFHASPRIQSVGLLLQEQIPQNAPIEEPYAEDGRAVQVAQSKVVTTPWRVRVHPLYPQVHFLSNGRYGLLITNSGGGFSVWQDVDLTRWQADTTLNNWGAWIYIRDLESGALWSASFQPMAVPTQSRDVYYSPHMAEFHRRDQEISSVMEISVAPEEDVEIRRITLTNHGDRLRRLSLTSYGEVILAPHAADLRHPAFNKLFIESEYLPQLNALLYRRRPRSEAEKPVYLLHSLVVEAGQPVTGIYEGDRLGFLGRDRTVRSPAALRSDKRQSGVIGATLDPILSLSQFVDLEPNESRQVTFLTLAAGSRPRRSSWQAATRPGM